MKHFRDQSYYELLEVEPDASLEEITRAYQSAQEAFNPDSVAIYSLFDSDEEREALLARIQDAYRILSNGRTRREYDLQINRGAAGKRARKKSADRVVEIPVQWEENYSEKQLEPAKPFPVDLEPPTPQPSPALNELPKEVLPSPRPLPSLVKNEGVPLEIEPGERIRGQDLVRLRESRGVRLSVMASRIRVNKETLKALETDSHENLPAEIYIKGFLRAYAQVLKLKPEELVEAYLLGMKAEE